MCIRPITITRYYPLTGVKTYDVPCGKCSECLSRKRSEIAALSSLEALSSGSVHFFTLTYSDEHLPVAISEISEDTTLPVVTGFEFGIKSGEAPFYKDGVFSNFLHFCEDGTFRACSLRREDVKLWLKQFRTNWKREKGSPVEFKYLIFGELGETRGRPHYHGLLYGLSNEQAAFAADIWRKRFGFVYFLPESNRVLSVDEIGKVSNYVSKYISKGVYSRWNFLLPHIEAPRRQSSINFGLDDKAMLLRLADFMAEAAFRLDFPLPNSLKRFCKGAVLF